MTIIGITGTLGAGKGTIVEYLVEKKGFAHFSVREYLLEEIHRRGMAENRDSMFNLANELRAQHGPAYVVDQLYLRAAQSSANCVIESIRTPGEIRSLREKGDFYLFAVDADPKIRYDRIHIRRSETDKVTFETFVENEAREMNTDDPNKQNLSACIAQADFIFTNNGNRDALFLNLEEALKQIIA